MVKIAMIMTTTWWGKGPNSVLRPIPTQLMMTVKLPVMKMMALMSAVIIFLIMMIMIMVIIMAAKMMIMVIITAAKMMIMDFM